MNKEKFYTIIKEEGVFSAIPQPRDYNVNFACFSESNINDLEQFGYALISTETDGTYSLIIPIWECRPSSFAIDPVCDKKAIKLITGITSYQYLNDMFLLEKEDYCLFICPRNYITKIDENNARTIEENLVKISFSKKAFIRKEFEEFCSKYLGEGSFGLNRNNCIICNIDKIDYLVRPNSIIPLGKAELLPSKCNCIKVINESKEYIHDGHPCDDKKSKVYDYIVPFSEDDYDLISEIFKNRECYGYWCKYLDGSIGEMSIHVEYDIYRIIPERPAKSITFVSRLRYSLPNIINIDIWKIVYADNKETKYFFKCNDTIHILDSDCFM